MDALHQLIPNFLFVLLRAGVVLMLLPFFGNPTLPPQFRIGVVVAFAAVLAPVIDVPVAAAPLPLLVVREVMFGILFGLGVRFVFYAVDMAGSIMSTSTGLSIATVFNPEVGQSTEVARLLGIIAILLFLAMDLHHDVIAVLVKSYEWLPVGSAVDPGRMSAAATALTGMTFVLALKIAAPLVIVMLIANIVLGLISKVIPQLNVMFVGFPIYIVLGFLVLMLSIPVMTYVMGSSFTTIKDELAGIIRSMQR